MVTWRLSQFHYGADHLLGRRATASAGAVDLVRFFVPTLPIQFYRALIILIMNDFGGTVEIDTS